MKLGRTNWFFSNVWEKILASMNKSPLEYQKWLK